MTNEEKKAIESFKEENNNDLSRFDDFNSYTQFKVKRDKLIIDLIEKQSKEIEELKAINKKLEARKYMYNAETGEVTAIPIDNNYISKDKIRAKIEIRKEEKENCKDSIEEKYLLREIYILQSLLKDGGVNL